MAVYRQIHTTFWNDPEVLEWTPEEKYFYLYLMTNPYTNQIGIYEISKRMMSMQLGYPIDTVSIHLKTMIDRNKIQYSEDTKEIYLINWIKYNKSTSPKVITLINKELETVKNQAFTKHYHTMCLSIGLKLKPLSIQYPYSINTLPQKEEEQEEEKELEEEQEEDTLQQLSNLWTQCGYGTLNGNTVDKLMADIEIYSLPWVLEAIEIGNTRNKRSYAYIKGILNKWQTDGKEERNEPGRKNNSNTAEERDYSTPIDLAKFENDDYSDLI
ncbi:MAG: DnaD domain protein [Prevotella sp.]|nr:DnaD domain protein [Prevotella sp.]